MGTTTIDTSRAYEIDGVECTVIAVTVFGYGTVGQGGFVVEVERVETGFRFYLDTEEWAEAQEA